MVVEISSLLGSPRPKTCGVDADDDELVDDDEPDVVFEAALVSVRGAMPRRPSALESWGPATSVAVTPGLT